jgi:two-component system nitrogen regulation response regulator GlnG
MAPGQTVEVKDLPHEFTSGSMTDITPAVSPSMVSSVLSEPLPAGSSLDRDPSAPIMVGAPMLDRGSWIMLLEAEAARMLAAGKPEVMDTLGRDFESALIKTALKHTHGRKNDAAIRLGIGRNTITRKIQELGIEGGKDE